MGSPEKHPLSAEDLAQVTGHFKEAASIPSGLTYFGEKASAPQIGDSRVSFELDKPGTFSIMAAQLGKTADAYPRGLETGSVSSSQAASALKRCLKVPPARTHSSRGWPESADFC